MAYSSALGVEHPDTNREGPGFDPLRGHKYLNIKKALEPYSHTKSYIY